MADYRKLFTTEDMATVCLDRKHGMTQTDRTGNLPCVLSTSPPFRVSLVHLFTCGTHILLTVWVNHLILGWEPENHTYLKTCMRLQETTEYINEYTQIAKQLPKFKRKG